MKTAAHRASPVARSRRTAELLAAGGVCALLVNPVAAVELGDIDIDSALGQPLRASIAFALGPNEHLNEDCVYLRSAAPAAGLPTITRARASLSGQRILLRGNTPLREPMMSLQIVVDCPYTARLRRDYLLLLNPPGLAAVPDRVEARAATPLAPVPRAAGSPPPSEPRRPAVAKTAVAPGRDYRVQPGDTLSGIASRIDDRRIGLWPAIRAIFAANPAAFRDGDVDRLIAGATLRIPSSVVSEPSLATPPAVVERVAYPGPGSAAMTATGERQPPRIEGAAVSPARVLPAPLTATDTRAGTGLNPDVTSGTDDAVAASAGRASDSTARKPDLSDEAPSAAAVSAVARPDIAATVNAPLADPIPLAGAADSPAQSWLVWLGGGGVAIFLALLIFGRRLRARFDAGARPAAGEHSATTADDEALQGRRSTDRRATDNGTDFDTGDDLDVALDYSFASSGEFDGELDFIVEESQITTFPPEDVGVPQEDTSPTREMPPRKTSAGAGTEQTDAVADGFPPPGRRPKDLETIEVEALDSPPRPAAGLDLTSEFDYEVLEKDYETELTATHALNVEIEQAARDLQRQLGEVDDDASQVSMAADLDGTAEVTAAMPADMVPSRATAGNDERDDAVGDDDTDINEAPTSKLPQSDETVEMDADATVEHRSKTG